MASDKRDEPASDIEWTDTVASGHEDTVGDTLAAATAPGDQAASGREVRARIRIGQVIADRFRVEARLGAGGMGIVYRAIDEALERPVAIKVLHTHISHDAKLVARFFREAKIVAQLSSNPNVITLYDVGRTPDQAPYLVMEYLEGKSLRSAMEDAGNAGTRLSRSYVIDVTLQIASALLDAHNAGIVHRDLKPENVFVVETRVIHHLVKVLDFGLSRSAGRPLPEQFATEVGAFVGTPRYAAPEFFSDVEPTAASDVYALGLILYELATNRFPLHAETLLGWLRAHTSDTPEPFPHMTPAYPDAIEAMVAPMLDKNPANRPRVDEIVHQLAVAQEQLQSAKAGIADL